MVKAALYPALLLFALHAATGRAPANAAFHEREIVLRLDSQRPRSPMAARGTNPAKWSQAEPAEDMTLAAVRWIALFGYFALKDSTCLRRTSATAFHCDALAVAVTKKTLPLFETARA